MLNLKCLSFSNLILLNLVFSFYVVEFLFKITSSVEGQTTRNPSEITWTVLHHKLPLYYVSIRPTGLIENSYRIPNFSRNYQFCSTSNEIIWSKKVQAASRQRIAGALFHDIRRFFTSPHT